MMTSVYSASAGSAVPSAAVAPRRECRPRVLDLVGERAHEFASGLLQAQALFFLGRLEALVDGAEFEGESFAVVLDGAHRDVGRERLAGRKMKADAVAGVEPAVAFGLVEGRAQGGGVPEDLFPWAGGEALAGKAEEVLGRGVGRQ